MHITIFAAGSQGDIQPCALLGRRLQQEGYDILLAAPENFETLAHGNKLRFHPLRGDVQQIMASDTGKKFMERGGTNPIRSILAMRKMLGPIALQMMEDAFEASNGADGLISLGIFATITRTIADILSIPMLNLEPTPLLPSRAFPAPGFPVQRNLGGLFNRLSGALMLQVIWLWYSPFVNDFRKRFSLKPYSSSSFSRILSSEHLLGAYSPKVIPHPPDWSEKVHLTGYWFQDAAPDWRPSKELEAFLERGEPPIYVGFGSMGGQNPESLAAVVLQALEKSSRRGLLLTGWGGLSLKKVPENVFVLNSAPHSWLFPRMAAVVHHGGAGTTAEGLRAGVPTVIVPFIVDQMWWGRRIKGLGVGPEPIPAQKVTEGRLSATIQGVMSDREMKNRAANLGSEIRAEDGLGNAVKVIRRYLGA